MKKLTDIRDTLQTTYTTESKICRDLEQDYRFYLTAPELTLEELGELVKVLDTFIREHRRT